MKLRRILGRFLLSVVILSALLSLWGFFLIRRSFPQTEGEIRLPGLDSEVVIYRDSHGIPHIYASTLHDLFYAQGYVHAQDRFWQMDVWRHIGAGRLAEMFGKSQVETDAFLRTMGWARLAEQELRESSPEAIAILTAYAEGVNAYLTNHHGAALSFEYVLLRLLNPRYAPEPWKPVHTLTWAKAMAWDLRGNIEAEIERALLLKTFSPEQIADLYPPYPSDHPVIVEQFSPLPMTFRPIPTQAETFSSGEPALRRVARNLAQLEALLGPSGRGIGSNAWVIAGTLTTTGKPILANDPHLGIQIPSIWYQMSLHCQPKSERCPYEVTGFSFAGAPGIIIGHNDRIAWGFTNVGPDVMDLYIERVNPENPNQYEVNGQWVDFETRTEVIQVSGDEPITITVRSTRHGPVISEVYGLEEFGEQTGLAVPEAFVISLRWTALQPQHIFEAIWGFNKAKNWQEFRAATRAFTVPAQNLVYADVDGNIGYQMPGQIPIRKNGDGRLPVPGWTDEYEWIGYIAFEDLPFVFNPQSGYIVTANNQSTPRDYPYLVTADWDYGFRAARIVEMIENAPGPIDLSYIQRMQLDSTSLNARTLLPILMSLPMEGRLEEARTYFLANWDGREEANSQSALFFERFWWNLLIETFYDEPFPEDYFPSGGDRFYEVIRRLVEQPNSPWWDNRLTPDTVETRDDIFLRAFAITVEKGEEKYGKRFEKWPTWGEVHSATFRHRTFGQLGIRPIEALFNRGPFPTGGGESIVNATGWKVGVSFEVDWLPSMRMIVDLSDFDRSLTVHTTGQSGHAFHPHYVDLAPLWASGQYYSMAWSPEVVAAQATSVLRLVPER
ncbi:MAG: penicillin acylase family protein [Anaerolineales bacterium]|nr:penicillin acylase family protein [Anaerolineales bacterium]MCX7608548.1 penicillin acylase family protein [Anaerolineales bacterium]